jgi:hypothetical protein
MTKITSKGFIKKKKLSALLYSKFTYISKFLTFYSTQLKKELVILL